MIIGFISVFKSNLLDNFHVWYIHEKLKFYCICATAFIFDCRMDDLEKQVLEAKNLSHVGLEPITSASIQNALPLELLRILTVFDGHIPQAWISTNYVIMWRSHVKIKYIIAVPQSNSPCKESILIFSLACNIFSCRKSIAVWNENLGFRSNHILLLIWELSIQL